MNEHKFMDPLDFAIWYSEKGSPQIERADFNDFLVYFLSEKVNALGGSMVFDYLRGSPLIIITWLEPYSSAWGTGEIERAAQFVVLLDPWMKLMRYIRTIDNLVDTGVFLRSLKELRGGIELIVDGGIAWNSWRRLS